MSSDEVISDKKKALLAYKQKLLSDIRDYERRIETIGLNQNEFIYDDGDSSDSESGFPEPMELGPSTKQLKLESSLLSLRLQATEELTSLTILESEVSVLTAPPKLQRSPAPTANGLWREVTAECRTDLVPFSITFYVLQPNTQFAPLSYHDLKVTPVKEVHARELARSALASVDKPSDAVQILRNYAVAHRERRSTLAKLAEKYSETLYMDAMADGGFVLKCANIIEIYWILTNKWSPVAPFHHRFKFDIEYMDEAYLQAIKQANDLLKDPSLEVSERTELLSNIIDVCLEANGGTSVQDSDLDNTISPIKKVTPLKRGIEIEDEIVAKRAKDSEVMAPPKSVPKKRASDLKRGKSASAVRNVVDVGKTVADVNEGKVGNFESQSKIDKKSVDKAEFKSSEEVKNLGKSGANTGNKDSVLKKNVKKSETKKSDDVAKKPTVMTQKKNGIGVKKSEVTKNSEGIAKKPVKSQNKDIGEKTDNATKNTEVVRKEVTNKEAVKNSVAKQNPANAKVLNKLTNQNYVKNVDKKDADKITKTVQAINKENNKNVTNKAGTRNIGELNKNGVNNKKPQEKIKDTAAIKTKSDDMTKKSKDFVPKKPIVTKQIVGVKIPKNQSSKLGPINSKMINKEKFISGNVAVQTVKPFLKTADNNMLKTKIPLPQNILKKTVTSNTKIPSKLTNVHGKGNFQNPVRMSPRTLKKTSMKTHLRYDEKQI